MVTIPCEQNALVTRKLWETSSKSTLSRRLCLGGPTTNKAIFFGGGGCNVEALHIKIEFGL